MLYICVCNKLDSIIEQYRSGNMDVCIYIYTHHKLDSIIALGTGNTLVFLRM